MKILFKIPFVFVCLILACASICVLFLNYVYPNYDKEIVKCAIQAINKESDRGSPVDFTDKSLVNLRQIFINSEIDIRTASVVVKQLLYLDSLNHLPITIFISSDGGNITEAFRVIDTINSVNSPVDTVALGGCYSAASYILASGTRRRMASVNSIISLHFTKYTVESEYGCFSIAAHNRLHKFSKDRLLLPTEWYPLNNADRTLYLSVEDAIKYGIIDKPWGDCGQSSH